MSDILKGLNPQQQKAVTAPDGPVLVLAGPGSGKTRVLTHRVSWLVLERDVPPWRIMAVTFTNKAAREMRERLERQLGVSRAAELTLGTFHATCARILRRDGDLIGVPPNYVIFDADDQVALVRQVLKDLNIDEKRYTPAAVHAVISRAKNELIGPESFQPASYFEEIARRVYEQYQQRLRANNGLDFDDLLMETVRLFREAPSVLARYQERYFHILVDEFQDTNMAQYVLLKQLAARHRNLFVVADEDQSIYRWRGADYRNISRLREDFPDLATYLLEQNYRSTQTILDVAQAIIRHNPNRTPKKLFTDRGHGPKVVIHEAYDPEEEAQYVVDTIARLTLTGEARPGDCAVMYRTNAQSRALEEAFIHAGLPYRLVGATRFYARREIKDLLAFLRVVHNPADSASLLRILNVPPRGIGAQTAQTLEDVARAPGVPVWQVIEEIAENRDQPPLLSGRTRTAVTAFHRLVRGWVEQIADSRLQMADSRSQIADSRLQIADSGSQARNLQSAICNLLDRIIADTGYEAYIRDGTDEGEERWENVQELRVVATQYADATLTDFLADVALVSDVDNLTDGVNAPTLLTLHSAKGLEFPVVFIVGLEEGLLPHFRSLDDPEALAEERRLMYVGVTRAKERLFLTHAFRRARWGDYEPNVPSRFLADIPETLTEGKRRKKSSVRSSWEPTAQAERTVAQADSLHYRVGEWVEHPTFGPGIVTAVRPLGDEAEVTVVFERVGLKRILGSYLRKRT